MAAPTQAELLELFPELAIHPTAVLDGALATAGRQCSEEAWGASHFDGVAYLAAHLITLRVRQVGASVNQRTADPSGEGYASTYYGQQYRALLATLPSIGFVV